MDARNYEYQSDFAKRYVAQGQLEAKVGVLLRLLANRKLTVSEEQREMIQKCTELELLDRWFDRVFEVSTADELFVG